MIISDGCFIGVAAKNKSNLTFKFRIKTYPNM